MILKKKGYLDISFGWLFAIIVGAFILFLAIYLSTKVIKTEQTEIDARTGKEIGVLLNPLETGFETSRTTSFTLPSETRIYARCSESENFGEQLIQISQKSFGKWTETEISVGFPNKYIFSKTPIEGKKFYVFSKQFEFPFKVSDLIYLTSSSDKYCFENPPEEIKDELKALKQENLLVENCSGEEVRICFNSGNCDIVVNYVGNYIDKSDGRIYFEGDALMYAAIFSDKEIYECQLKRLMQRTKELALLYDGKAKFVSQRGCNSNLNLIELSNSAENLEDSTDLNSVNFIAEEIQNENKLAECRLW